MQDCLSSFSCSRPSTNPEITHREAIKSANSGNFENAKLLYEKSIKLYEKKYDNVSLTKVYSDFASLHFRLGNFDEAIELFKKSLKLFEINGCGFLDTAKINLKIASCYCEKNELNQASSHIQDALKVADSRHFITNHRDLVDIYADAQDLYKKMHDKNKQSLASTRSFYVKNKQSLGSPRPIDVQNTYKGGDFLPALPPSPEADSSFDCVRPTGENIQQGREDNYFSKHINCLQKAIDFSCNIFLKDREKYLDDYDVPNKNDAIKFSSNLNSLDLALRENNNLNAEFSNELRKTLIESLPSSLSSISNAVVKFPELRTKFLGIRDRLSSLVECESIKDSPYSGLITPATQISSQALFGSLEIIGYEDNGAGVFSASRQ